MRSFSFRAKNIGRERYLTYISGEGSEIDEEVLDYCEENHLRELIDIIYEEDDDFDYLTYDVTGRMTLEKFMGDVMDCEKVLNVLRNIALAMVSLKEQAIHLSYIILNKGFIYIDPDSLEIKLICLPVDSEGAVSMEFKGFVRQFLANLKYDVEEDLGYVGKLLTYINGDSFNLRGLIGLVEAIMEDEGLEHSDESVVESEDGSEVVNIAIETEEEQEEKSTGVSDFMNSLDGADEALPEIGDDDETEAEADKADEDDDVDVAELFSKNLNPDGETQVLTGESAETPFAIKGSPEAEEEKPDGNEAPEAEPEVPEDPMEEIKARIEMLARGEVPVAKTAKKEAHSEKIHSLDELDTMLEQRPVVKKQTIKVNRAAIIQNAAEHEEENQSKEETAELSGEEKEASADVHTAEAEDAQETADAVAEEKELTSTAVRNIRGGGVAKGASNVNNSILGNAGTLKISPYLIRVNTEERIMLTKPVFKLGKASRGVDYTIDGNGAVSRQHAVIMQKEGSCYIKDNKSTNHTYVDGERVGEGEEVILRHDCKVRLGDEEFIFKLR